MRIIHSIFPHCLFFPRVCPTVFLLSGNKSIGEQLFLLRSINCGANSSLTPIPFSSECFFDHNFCMAGFSSTVSPPSVSISSHLFLARFFGLRFHKRIFMLKSCSNQGNSNFIAQRIIISHTEDNIRSLSCLC